MSSEVLKLWLVLSRQSAWPHWRLGSIRPPWKTHESSGSCKNDGEARLTSWKIQVKNKGVAGTPGMAIAMGFGSSSCGSSELYLDATVQLLVGPGSSDFRACLCHWTMQAGRKKLLPATGNPTCHSTHHRQSLAGKSRSNRCRPESQALVQTNTDPVACTTKSKLRGRRCCCCCSCWMPTILYQT